MSNTFERNGIIITMPLGCPSIRHYLRVLKINLRLLKSGRFDAKASKPVIQQYRKNIAQVNKALA